MQNHYPLWKNLLLVVVVAVALVYAVPNFYGEEPIIQISPATDHQGSIAQDFGQQMQQQLQQAKISVKSVEFSEREWVFRFHTTDSQLLAKDVLKGFVSEHYVVALNLVSTTPSWLQALGAYPMKLGLDLRGGLHFLLDVDVEGVLARKENGLYKQTAQALRKARIRYQNLIRKTDSHDVMVQFKTEEQRDAAYQLLQKEIPDVLVNRESSEGFASIRVGFDSKSLEDIRQRTVEQTMRILRNRVDELGVAEAVVHQQGKQRVVIDLPGIQDATRAKEILGGTATLEFHMVAEGASNSDTHAAVGGARAYQHAGRQIWLKNQIILSGDAITHAAFFIDQETARPAVSIQLGGGGEHLFHKTTRENIGKPMSIVYVESKLVRQLINGQWQKKHKKTERVISVATIQSALGNRFQITGLSSADEARNLALLLRAGALPAATDIVEEKTVGPTLGAENIAKGVISLVVGMILVVLFMAAYYRLFGIIANVALLLNLILLMALLSLIGATMTLPGIAAMVLTLGMAVDANVLIYERIREELRAGVGVQAAINAGYERAFATIVDANLTTLIVGAVLFAIGSGAIQAFAVVLVLGLMTSMFTAVGCTRALVNWRYGGKRVERLSIGI